ncbi:MAG: DUF2905 family protein [Deltaproteobacteria bacterium]|nr:DUF2905 family protein [Deltaproteobacteria bacterium]NIS76476.1 DUF2905 family protein [Deltaproteobacteria bacterium]
MDFHWLGRLLATAGILLFIVGVLLMFFPKIPLLGKLPGDIYIRRENFTFYFPITTCILLSILLTLILLIFKK